MRALFMAAALALVAFGGAGAVAGHAAHGIPTTVPPGRCPPPPPGRPPEHRLTRPTWLADVVVTEYYPAPEKWFRGALVAAPGLEGKHRVDWLYSSSGVAMEGDGVGLDGRRYHFAGPYGTGWVTSGGADTLPCPDGSWTRGWPAWLSFGWRTKGGAVTFPLAAGGWSAGAPARYLAPPSDLRFAPAPSRPLRYWRSVAVDPDLIPLGSRVFVRAYCRTPGAGWFLAQDTGGAIIARHLDVYRPAPASPDDGRMLRGQRVFVIPPGTRPARLPRC